VVVGLAGLRRIVVLEAALRVPGFLLSIGFRMDSSQQKVVQYLGEARATEDALVRVLQSQIAMTPGGSYRSLLESHLRETREHASDVASRLEELDQGSNPVQAVIGFWESVIGQTLAVSKAPLDLLRGSGAEEKVLKNAKDTCATEALEIATYTAIERLARSVGDQKTAKLAASICAQEEQMLDRVMREIPKLTDAVVGADVKGKPSYDVTTTGAADAGRKASHATKKASRKATTATKRTSRQARKVPGVAQAEGQLKGAVASQGDLAIARYDALTAEEIIAKLSELSQIELAKVDSYERKNQNRTTILSRITTLRGNEPWPGYDELTANDVQAALGEGDEDRANQTRSYERAHKNRQTVLQATEREHSNV
jgi:ferritin-like metal-binding protein YciE